MARSSRRAAARRPVAGHAGVAADAGHGASNYIARGSVGYPGALVGHRDRGQVTRDRAGPKAVAVADLPVDHPVVRVGRSGRAPARGQVGQEPGHGQHLGRRRGLPQSPRTRSRTGATDGRRPPTSTGPASRGRTRAAVRSTGRGDARPPTPADQLVDGRGRREARGQSRADVRSRHWRRRGRGPNAMAASRSRSLRAFCASTVSTSSASVRSRWPNAEPGRDPYRRGQPLTRLTRLAGFGEPQAPAAPPS